MHRLVLLQDGGYCGIARICKLLCVASYVIHPQKRNHNAQFDFKLGNAMHFTTQSNSVQGYWF